MTKHTLDWGAVAAVVFYFLGYIPAILSTITAILACVWWAIRVYETRPVQNWLNRRRARKA